MDFFEIYQGGPKMMNGGCAYPVGTDAVLLADFANMSGCRRVLDIGCGSGVISLILAHRNKNLSADGIEIDPSAADEARCNVRESGLEAQVNIITGDFRQMREVDLGGRYDAVVSNPPYFPIDGGKLSPDAARLAARSETSCTLQDLVDGAKRLTKFGGKFFLVYKPERLAEALFALREAGLEPKRLRTVHGRAELPAAVVLIECRLGGKTGMKVEPPLVMANDDGTDTDEVKKIYRRFGKEEA